MGLLHWQSEGRIRSVRTGLVSVAVATAICVVAPVSKALAGFYDSGVQIGDSSFNLQTTAPGAGLFNALN